MNEQRLRKRVPQAAMPSAESSFLLSMTLNHVFRFQPEREGRGGEKAAQGDASLPVPPIL